MDSHAPLPLAFVLALMGAAVGSFIGTIADREPAGEPIGLVRSKCDVCDSVLRPTDLIPIVSFLLLRGRCSHCNAPIPRRLILIEAMTLVITIVVLAIVPFPTSFISVVFAWLLVAASWFDILNRRIPDFFTIPLLLLGLAATWLLSPNMFAHAVIGAGAGYVSFAALRRAFKRIAGRDGLGGGDVRLVAAVGAWVGWQGLPTAILIASAVALTFALTKTRSISNNFIPFGPFVSLGSLLVWVTAVAQSELR